MSSPKDKARKIFTHHGGILRTTQALAEGIHPRSLYEMRDDGDIVELTRGIYRLADLPPLGDPDLTTIAKRIPDGIICLISALAHHRLTTQIPHEVQIALPRTARQPVVYHPPLRVFRFSGEALTAGIEKIIIDAVTVRMYCAEKSIADAFKFRNKIGIDVALEALRMYRKRKGARVQGVLEFARVCRVEKVVRPYLEAGNEK